MYRVELEQFEGPMDLLLFFIKRDEIDIYDIPIARIADEYLAYVRVMEEIDLDGVGDFIYMAALLINIKARLLLPSQETDEEGEAVDVRGDAADDRERMEESHEVEVDSSVFELVEALGRVLEEEDKDEDPVHEVEAVDHTVEEQQQYVVRRLARESRVPFRELVRHESRGFVIATFLALLELARQQYIRLHVEENTSDFVVKAREDQPLRPDDPAHEGLDLATPQGDGAIGDGPDLSE
ncbi:MAG: segregation/condensation protein A [Bacteroidetes bacterium QH_2_64_74]|nr:MAG: segregation/condensation protein A [Bacteroidetes bacterium QH_2_64_74]